MKSILFLNFLLIFNLKYKKISLKIICKKKAPLNYKLDEADINISVLMHRFTNSKYHP